MNCCVRLRNQCSGYSAVQRSQNAIQERQKQPQQLWPRNKTINSTSKCRSFLFFLWQQSILYKKSQLPHFRLRSVTVHLVWYIQRLMWRLQAESYDTPSNLMEEQPELVGIELLWKTLHTRHSSSIISSEVFVLCTCTIFPNESTSYLRYAELRVPVISVKPQSDVEPDAALSFCILMSPLRLMFINLSSEPENMGGFMVEAPQSDPMKSVTVG